MVPSATYRLQLRPGFGFAEAAEIAPYIAELGASHAYFSPYLQAAPGSAHGYDVVDPTQVNRELGGPQAHARMVEALRAHGLGQVIDVVPNHMAINTPENRFWWDVLEHGRCSRYATYFDIDWRPVQARLRDKVLIPILGDHYGRVLEAGAIRIERSGARFVVRVYDDHLLPMEPGSIGELLSRAAASCEREELGFIADALRWLPGPTETQPDCTDRRYRDTQVLAGMLERLLVEEPACARAVDAAVQEVNANPDALAELLERQSYRLSYWRIARHELDYRRFFDIDTLAAVRVERPEVFAEMHALPLHWAETGEVSGLRIDHPDGLRDPTAYLTRLRERTQGKNTWIVVEKILGADEVLPESWPVDGTTGYDFANLLTGLFVNPAAEQALTDTYADFTGTRTDFETLAREKKRFVLDELLASELGRLTSVLIEVCEHNPRFRDYSRQDLQGALRELIACMPVYRTYVTAGDPASERDRGYIAHAVTAAERAEPQIDGRLLGFVARILKGEQAGPAERELCARFQQLSAATMAKGVEDTAFYNYARLTALNEVGGEPGRFGVSIEQFHAHCARIAQVHPGTMLATSTHDTKRSEDVRVRIALLSEMPSQWREVVQRWSALAQRHRQGEWPDRETEYLLWQTLVGAYPIDEDRLCGYLQKAMREAKAQSSWHRPNEDYERAVLAFARSVLNDSEIATELTRFTKMLAEPAHRTSLAQLALKLTAPGVPDIYQGNEVFRYDLTDPDNRRPVDFAALRAKLQRVRELDPRAVIADADAGLSKLLVTQRLLELRKREPDAFGTAGGYQPLLTSGARADHVVAYLRGDRIAVVVPRLLLGLGRELELGDTQLTLPEGTFEHCFTLERVAGGPVRASALFAAFPVAVLRRVAA